MTGRSGVVVAGALVVVAVLAFLFGRMTAPNSQVPPSSNDVGSGPTDQVAFPQTRAGAVSAARRFSIVMSSVSTDRNAYLESMEAIAAPGWEEEAVDLAENTVAFLEDNSEAATSTFTPIRYRVLDYSESRASIAVWGVTLINADETSAPDESWVTGTLQLVWSDGWKVDGGTSEAGPTPRLLQTQSGGQPEALRAFEDYADVEIP